MRYLLLQKNQISDTQGIVIQITTQQYSVDSLRAWAVVPDDFIVVTGDVFDLLTSQIVTPPNVPIPAWVLRERAYIAQLGIHSTTNPIIVLGDVLNTLIAQVEAIRSAAGVAMTPDYQTLITKVAAIHAAYPDP